MEEVGDERERMRGGGRSDGAKQVRVRGTSKDKQAKGRWRGGQEKSRRRQRRREER